MEIMPSSLISTKLHIPPAPPDLIPRPQLIDSLDAALKRPLRLILISAPAGFGKTTLVAEWLRHTGMPAAWLSLDRDDNDPARFWSYVVAALQAAEPGFGRGLPGAFDSQPPLPALIAALINDLAGASRPALLVLDDYHWIENEAIHAGINGLLDRLPPTLRIVITTRADPPLALSRLRSRDQVTEARTADLRFSREEAAAFLNRIHNLDLAEEDISFLEHRTEGWIVGLQLAALSLHRQSDRHAFVAAFAGDDRYIVDYLLQEVLAQQPPEVRSFLLRTSILDRMCGPLCDAVTGLPDSEPMLRQLEESNLFILPLDNRRYWYRYHMLFADLLRRRMEQELPPEQRAGLYRRAAEWFEQEGFLYEAIAHSLSAPDYPLAARLLERHALTFFFRSESNLLRGWLKRIPEDLLRTRPLLCAVYAHTIAHFGLQRPPVVHAAETWIGLATQALNALSADEAAAADRENLELARNFIALSNAYLAYWRNEDPRKVIELARRALADLPAEESLPADSNYLRLRGGLNFILGMSQIAAGDDDAADRAFLEARKFGEISGDWLNAYAAVDGQCFLLRRRGRLAEAAAACRDALESIGRAAEETRAAPVPYSGALHIDLGLVLLEWNELRAAEESLRTGLELMQMAANTGKQAEAMVALAEIRRIRGDPSAFLTLQQAEKTMPEIRKYSALYDVTTWLRQGNPENAFRWAEGRQLNGGRGVEAPALARVILAGSGPIPPRRKPLGLPDAAALRQFLERQIPIARDEGWTDRLIEWHLLLALAWQVERESAKAVLSLRQALSLAREGRYIRRFIGEGEPVLQLLRQMEGKSGELDPYIGRLLSAGAVEEIRAPEPAAQPLVEPLSGRELQVLRLMALGDSNAEIAKKLVITLNTTKKHITHIFEKLEVANRSKAVVRARELGLVA
jgi:LuxR family maltose regulon positive regulatory protein